MNEKLKFDRLKQKLLGFDVDKYLMWVFSEFYSQIEFVGMKEVSEMEESDRKEYLNDLERRRANRVIWKPDSEIELNRIISKEKFETMLLIVSDVRERESRLNERLETGMIPPTDILEDEMNTILREINEDIFYWISRPLPILESYYFEIVGLLNEIRYLKVIEERELESIQQPAQDKSQLNLPQKICLLHRMGFFDSDEVLRMMNEEKGKLDKIVSLLLNGDVTNTRKNINALQKPDNKFNPRKHSEFIEKYF